MRFLQLINRFVSVILVSVALTAALQFSGVASHAKDSADYVAASTGTPDYASDVIDGIFNIPIATLNAVSSLVQQTGPLLKMAAEQRVEARKARAELLRARAADRDARNDAKAARRAEQGRSIVVTRVKQRPAKVQKTILVAEENEE